MIDNPGVVEQILDLARWAPSGDNTQPWRFEVLSDSRFVVHGSDTRRHVVYDLDGRPSQMALGALLETLTIAASGLGMRAAIKRRYDLPEDRPTFDVELAADPGAVRSPLFHAIPLRSVQRRSYSMRPLTLDEKASLEAALPAGYRLPWFEGAARRWQVASLLFASAKIRLTIEEAWRVHREVIAWKRRYSRDRVPDQALGVDNLSLAMMRWGLQEWKRVEFLNRYMAGTWLPRVQMDLLPAFRCAAHFAIVADSEPIDIDGHVEAGRAMQRVWLAATMLGLQHQPEVTPLIFARFVRNGVAFTTSHAATELATRVSAQACEVIGNDLSRVVWLGRIGQAPFAQARSLRRWRHELTIPRRP